LRTLPVDGIAASIFKYHHFNSGIMPKHSLDRTVFFLGSCSTCQKILRENRLEERGFRLRDIKESPITPEELDAMKEFSSTYESLFSRRAIKYRQMGLGDLDLKEKDYRKLILQEYTFLKRPVIIQDGMIFVGSEKATRAMLQEKLGK